MKTILIVLLSLCSLMAAQAQKYLTKTGHISFFSEAPLENIEANNNQVTSILDVETGQMVFSLLMKGFQFEKALMQEHFNEKYVHSEKYPKATFQGKILNLEDIDLNKAGEYNVEVEGNLNLHGVSKEVKVPGTIEISESGILAKAVFDLILSEYEVKIPALVKDNISEVVEIKVEMDYKPFGK